MSECKDCLSHPMCYLCHSPNSTTCGQFLDKNKYVEVVRCKDCMYWEKRLVNSKGFAICSASGMDITENDFCSYGERREGE